jgi:predicted RNase H-like nuclease (RuvC/YqgF family)
MTTNKVLEGANREQGAVIERLQAELAEKDKEISNLRDRDRERLELREEIADLKRWIRSGNVEGRTEG